MPDSGFLPTQAEQSETAPPTVTSPEAGPDVEVASAAAVEAPSVHQGWDEVAVEEERAAAAMRAAEERAAGSPNRFLERTIEIVGPTTPMSEVAPRDELQMEVARILEEELGEFVEKMAEAPKALFLKKGAEVAMRITAFMRAGRLNARQVKDLIRDWLLTTPSINKLFLEQVAKIKTDEIFDLDHARREGVPSAA